MKPMTARQVETWLKANGCIRSHGVGSHRGWINPANGMCRPVPPHEPRHTENHGNNQKIGVCQTTP